MGPWWNSVNDTLHDIAHWVDFPSVFWAGWYDIFTSGQLHAFKAYTHSPSRAPRQHHIVVDALGHCETAEGPWCRNRGVRSVAWHASRRNASPRVCGAALRRTRAPSAAPRPAAPHDRRWACLRNPLLSKPPANRSVLPLTVAPIAPLSRHAIPRCSRRCSRRGRPLHQAARAAAAEALHGALPLLGARRRQQLAHRLDQRQPAHRRREARDVLCDGARPALALASACPRAWSTSVLDI